MASDLEGLPEAVAEQFFTTTDVPLSTWAQAAWPSLFNLLGVVAALTPNAGVPQLARLVSEFFTAAPEEAISYAAKGAESVPKALHVIFLDQLAALASGDTETLRGPAGSAIISLDPSDENGRFRSALERCIERNLFNRARSLITANRDLTDPYIGELVDQTLGRLRGLTTADLLGRGLALASTVLPDMSDAQRDELRDILGQAVQSADEAVVTTAAESVRELVTRDEFENRGRELIKVAFNHLKVLSPAPMATLVFVAEHVRLLGRLERGGFIAHLASLIKDASQRPSAVAALQQLPDVEPREREEIVHALIDVEIMEPAESNRIEYLRLSKKIAMSRGNAARLVKERLDELAKGSDADRQVHDAVQGSGSSEA